MIVILTMNEKNKCLIGYDNNGRVIDSAGCIQRIINPEYYRFAEEIYHIYKISNLNEIGIVHTELDVESKDLIHEKHIISYPYEWPAEMYQDAVLFHLNLFIELDKYGLTLKDALPSNILFKSTQPVFVDFLSIIKNTNLSSEEWLVKGASFQDRRFAVVERMLIPFMLVPLVAMINKNYHQARVMLSEQACNMSNASPQFIDVFPEDIINKNMSIRCNLKNIIKLFFNRNNYRNACILFQLINSHKVKNEPGFINYIKKIYDAVKCLDVKPPTSCYASYYDEKKENFDFANIENWGEKQKNVYAILKQEKPETVIDIGANTGWFSFLAENMGSKVTAIDIDENCVNNIYRIAKQENKKILPLLLSFDNLLKKYYGVIYGSPEYADRDFKNTALFLAPINRLKGDIVMCLGLLHHLVLGMGHEISFVFQVLSQMTNKSILTEFVDISDLLIKNEPSFFKNLYKYNENNYNIALVIKEGKKFFKDVEIFDSHPETRKLILFKN